MRASGLLTADSAIVLRKNWLFLETSIRTNPITFGTKWTRQEEFTTGAASHFLQRLRPHYGEMPKKLHQYSSSSRRTKPAVPVKLSFATSESIALGRMLLARK